MRESSSASILDPAVVQRKGAPKRFRLKGPLESQVKKTKTKTKAKATKTTQGQTTNVASLAIGDVVPVPEQMWASSEQPQLNWHLMPAVLPYRPNTHVLPAQSFGPQTLPRFIPQSSTHMQYLLTTHTVTQHVTPTTLALATYLSHHPIQDPYQDLMAYYPPDWLPSYAVNSPQVNKADTPRPDFP